VRRRLVLRREDDRLRRGALQHARASGAPRRRRARLARLRKPYGCRGSARRGGRARSRLWRRDRRHPLGEARWPDRNCLRARLHRRDARPRATRCSRGWPRERPLPEGRDRADPTSGRVDRRRHLQLRYQPLGRQARSPDGDGASAEAPRPARDPMWSRRIACHRNSVPSVEVTSAASQVRSR
jgi:hypothetical protein